MAELTQGQSDGHCHLTVECHVATAGHARSQQVLNSPKPTVGEYKTGMAHRGETIRRLREEAGLTQQQVGDIVGVTKAQISRIERGENTTVDRLKEICALFGKRGEFVVLDSNLSLSHLSHDHREMVYGIIQTLPQLDPTQIEVIHDVVAKTASRHRNRQG